jgi:asparagine synthase (glutamine-hydrolysing)
MCGINAILGYAEGAPPVDRAELLRVRDSMAARGPDDSGDWLCPSGRVGLGHRRLAVIDPSPAGHQPMALGPGRPVVTFNGEIYNFRELRAELVAQGRQLRTQSDTEVLLHLYDRDGAGMVAHLRGMYAFAIWDPARRGMLLARDPFGIKQLYYADDGRTLRLASTVKALRLGGGIDSAPSAAGHVGFFLWGHVPDPFTLYDGIRGLPAGSTLWVDGCGVGAPETFFDIGQVLREGADAGRGAAIDLHGLMVDTVRHHFVSDVPVGVFLSAGIDSAAIAAFASELDGPPLRTLTLGFDEYAGSERDEAPLAETVAARFGTIHQTRRIRRDDFAASAEAMFAAMDQPTIDGTNVYFVAREAHAIGLKVALSGLGGDELFGGYPSFRQVPRMVGLFGPAAAMPWLGRGLRMVGAPLLRRFTSPKYAGLLEYGGDYGSAYLLRRGLFMPWELPKLLDPELVREGWGALETRARLDRTVQGLTTPRQKVAALELSWYMRNQLLRDADWAGMAHSLEIRVPFVDPMLLRGLAPALASSTPPGKGDLARAPRSPLPDAILNRPKTGFEVPVREWLLASRPEMVGESGFRGWAREVYRRYGAGVVPAA